MVMTHEEEVKALLNNTVSEEPTINDIPFGDVMEYAYCLGIELNEVTYKGYAKWAKAVEDGSWRDMVTRWALSGPNGGTSPISEHLPKLPHSGYRTKGVYTTNGTRLDPTPQEKIEGLEEKVQTLQGELWELKNAVATVLKRDKGILVDVTSSGKMEKLFDTLQGGMHVVKIDGIKFKLNGSISIEGEVTWQN